MNRRGSDPRYLHLGIHIDGAGNHPAAWRLSGARPERLFEAAHFVELAQLAERGRLDFVVLDDAFRLQSNRADHVRGRLDALLTMARIAPVTDSIGLVPTVTTTHTEPFHVSKNVATLDFVSHGRAGWLVDVSATEEEASHFGRRDVASTEDLYAEAGEAIDVVRQLWDSWEDDAVIRDVPSGRYVDRDRLHYTNFTGRFFSVRGPSITPRSPQAQPLVLIEGFDDGAVAVGIRMADVIIIEAATVEVARDLRTRIDDGLRLAGRDHADVTVMAAIDVLLDATVNAAQSVRAELDAMARPHRGELDFVGDAAALADLFALWIDAEVVDGFVIRPSTLPHTLVRLVEEVVPILQSRGLFRTAYDGRTLRDHFHLSRPLNRYAPTSLGGN